VRAPGWMVMEPVAGTKGLTVLVRVRKWHPGYWLMLWRAPQDVPFWFRAWFVARVLFYRGR
jgi:hypothetical protein